METKEDARVTGNQNLNMNLNSKKGKRDSIQELV